MAIAPDNSTSYVAVGTGVTSTSFTIATGGYLMAAGDRNFTGGTYNGVALSLLFTFVSPISDGNQQTITVYGLANPASGANTFNATGLGASNSTICLISYTGMNRSAIVPEASNSAYSNSAGSNTQVTTLSTSVTTLTDNAWTILFASGGNNSPQLFTNGVGTTFRVSNNGNGLAGAIGILDSGGAISPVGTSTLTANWTSGSGFMTIAIFSVAQDVPVTFVPQMTII